MSELISGKEALIALANGDEVECSNSITGMDWCDATGLLVKSFFDATHMWEFRLKPRTISINGIEVPAPFEPKEGDTVFIPVNFLQQGYMEFKHPTFEGHCYQFGAWRTEAEIKQVVSALRSVFKPQ